MIPLAKELPELRERLIAFCVSGTAAPLMGIQVNDAPQEGESVADTPDIAYGTAAAERDALALREAELFQIHPYMVDLLGQAREGIGEAGFMDYDLPASAGLAHFAVALERRSPNAELPDDIDRHNQQAIAAGTPELAISCNEATRRMAALTFTEHLLCVWRTVAPSARNEHGAVELSWWFERDAWLDRNQRLSEAIGDRDEPLHVSDAVWRVLPQFVPDGRDILPFGAAVTVTDGKPAPARFDTDDYFRSTRPDMFRALCFLMRQRVAESSTVLPDRAARRRMARDGREPAPVRVISLRGSSGVGTGESGRAYVHRWMVRGHWRRQWYRSIQQHRPVWITPYVKGPEDAPMLGGEKVYSVRAPTAVPDETPTPDATGGPS